MSDQSGAIWLFRQTIRALSISIPCRRRELARFYAEADAFVLASREEGLAYVLAQALASGLPVICTDRTGGADLAHTPALAQRITIIPHDDLSALVAAVVGLRDRHKAGERPKPLADSGSRRRSHGQPTGVVMLSKSRLILVNAAGLASTSVRPLALKMKLGSDF